MIATSRDDAGDERLQALGAEALTVDVVQPRQRQRPRLAARWREDRPGVWYVAGVIRRPNALTPPTQQDFDAVMHTNVLGAMQVVCRNTGPSPMVAEAQGVFAFVSSSMSQIGSVPNSGSWLLPHQQGRAEHGGGLRPAFDYPGATLITIDPGWVQTDMGWRGWRWRSTKCRIACAACVPPWPESLVADKGSPAAPFDGRRACALVAGAFFLSTTQPLRGDNHAADPRPGNDPRRGARFRASAELWPHAARWDREHYFPKEAHQGLAALGAYGICVPEDLWRCAGLDYLTLALVLEEIAAGDGGTSTAISVTNCPVNAILMRYGNAQQKKDWLTPLATGPHARRLLPDRAACGVRRLRATTTTAVRQGDEYVINGVKQFITSGKNGHVAIVIAVTDKGAGKKGMSAFLVPTDNPGYVVARLEDKLGQHSSDTAQINFDNCRIPAENLIGAEGEGYKIALGALEGGRIGIAAQSVGMARSAFDAALAYSKERESFGTAIFNHQAVGFRLAECATQIEAARQLIWHAAALRDAGRPCLKEAAMAKLFASEMAERVCSAAIQTLGGYGVVNDFPVERIYRDVRVCQIYEGTSDVQKIIIQRALA